MDENLVIPRLQQLCADIGTPFAGKVGTLLSKRDWDSLATLEVNPHDYSSASPNGVSAYAADVGLAALFVKNADLPTSFNRKKAALDRWWLSEKLCCATNARFGSYLTGYYPDVPPALLNFFDRVQKRVAAVLGPLPRTLRGVMGPGSVYEATDYEFGAKSLTCADKTHSPAATAGLHELLQYPCFSDRYTDPCRFGVERDVTRVRGSRWSSAPKNAKTERAIAIEPGVNVYVQLGIETHLWDRLGRIGIYKATTQERHRHLAKQALSLGLATLDESMASDLWARNAVRFLLAKSPLWLSLLESTRCPLMLVEGKWVFLEKFSSMGNGWTFPLQTILFHSLVRELCGEDSIVSCFGDDIICPSVKAEEVMAALKFFGHRPNVEKSFWTGEFRESCGEDFFAGRAVRPHYLSSWPTDVPDWYALANGLRRRASSRAHLAFAAWCVRRVPLQHRFGALEDHYGDSVLLGRKPVTRTKNGLRQIRGLRYVGRVVHIDHFSGPSVLTAVLMGHSLTYRHTSNKSGPVGHLPTRGVSGWKSCWLTRL